MTNKLQLFILPFAGGDAHSFNRLLPMLNPAIDTHVINYSGRLYRRREGYITDYNDFLIDVANQIKKVKDDSIPYVLFGYSLGSVLLYDLVINKMLQGELKHVFICSKGSLHNKTNVDHSDGYSNDEVIDEMKYLGGTDERILNNPRFLAIYLEPVKMDFNIWRQFIYKPGKIAANATMIYSKLDPAAKGVEDWDYNIEGKTEYFEMGRNHFFIKENWEIVAQIVNNNIKQYL